MDPFTLTIFGVTSNLAKLKLIPALYDLEEKNSLPQNSKIVGIARGEYSKDEFRKYIEGVLQTENRHHQHPTSPEVTNRLLAKMEYLRGDIEGPSGKTMLYNNLKDRLFQNDFPQNHIYYLATYPNLYETIFKSLKKHGLGQNKKGWVRLMIEKPIGSDYKSAKKLDDLLHQFFQEEQIYRLDHYLGKETFQNILIFRFGNGILQPLMNNKYIDHIQITAAEDFGIGARGGYFDTMGTLRDVGQNHLLQMVVAATMDSPKEFSNRTVTDKRIEILQNFKSFPDKIVFGQYNGYLYEEKVDPKSKADTFFALKTEINNKTWKGVPIYIRAGKKLAQFVTEISVVFKVPVNRMFQNHELGNRPNVLTYRIQPHEGIGLELLSKVPGHKFQLESDYMQFCYRTLQNTHYDAYEKLIYDAMMGDPTFFNDAPEVEAAWKFVDKYTNEQKVLHLYDPGTWGPEEANKLIEADGRKWIEPSPLLCNIY
jgi:glucose-6-phosphate 1-dehydrogenase